MAWRRATIGVLTAAATLAALAAASASATNLCTEAPNAENECPAGKAYGVGQVFEASSVGPLLKTTTLGVIACESSAMKFEVTELFVGFAA